MEKKSFTGAAKHRYDNEGKKAKTSLRKEGSKTKPAPTTKAGSAETGGPTVNAPAAATKRSAHRSQNKSW